MLKEREGEFNHGGVMTRFTSCITGQFSPESLKRYLLVEAGVFWGLILLCRGLYPKENHFSIMTHTFSFMGSFDPNHNPRFWFLFTLAMVFWGITAVPLILYLHRRFATISRWAVWPGTLLMLSGCLGTILVGIFPDAQGKVFGMQIRHTDIHQKVALISFMGFGFGIPLYSLISLKDFLFGVLFGRPQRFNHRRVVWPFGFFFTVYAIAAHFQIKWESVYVQMKATAQAAGTPIGSHWSEALNTIYSFPFWENLLIYTLYIFIAWLCISVPQEK